MKETQLKSFINFTEKYWKKMALRSNIDCSAGKERNFAKTLIMSSTSKAFYALKLKNLKREKGKTKVQFLFTNFLNQKSF